MPNEYIVLPMFAMVVLITAVGLRMIRCRIRTVKAGEVDGRYYKTYQGFDEPREARQLSRHFVNLFELPVIFYVAFLAALTLQMATTTFQVLAWLFVLGRLAHTVVHTGDNKIMRRLSAYVFSFAMVLAMWAVLVWNILMSA